jgi:hypothetical protein
MKTLWMIMILVVSGLGLWLHYLASLYIVLP